MKSSLLNKSLLLLSALSASAAMAANDCEAKYADKKFDRVVKSATGAGCVGILKPENYNSSDPIHGDMVWLPATGNPVRIGGVPRNLVVTDSGVLQVLTVGKELKLESWDAATSQVTLCKGGMKVEEFAKKALFLQEGKDFVQVRDATTTISYFANCANKGKEVVYLDLSPADRKTLEKYGSGGQSNHLTDPKVVSTLPEILGRDELVDQLIGNLRSSQKRSTIMWGPAGVGKTALVYHLSRRIVEKRVPEWLRDWSIYNIDISKLSEDGLKGKSQQKIGEIIDAAAGKKVILLFDEIHQLVGLGATDDASSDVTETLKTTLANGQLAILGTTTDAGNELALLRTRDAFFSRFAKMTVGEPNDETLMIIYRATAAKLAIRHNVQFSESLLKDLIGLTRQYVPNENHPRIGISLLENLAAKMEVQQNTGDNNKYAATLPDLRNEIGVYANVQTLKKDGTGKGGQQLTFQQKVARFKSEMQNQYVGNISALETVHKSLVTYAAGNNITKGPAGVFLFLGPSGVGKTYLAELTAQYFNMEYKEWGMSQFVDDSNVTTFLGAPPSFVGFNPAGGLLTQFLNQHPTSVLNFDEVDKAEPRILEALMGLIDTGKIKDNAGVEAEFKNGFIFMTSNFGMDMIDAYDRAVLGLRDPLDDPNKPKQYPFPIPRTEAELKNSILNKLRTDGKLGTYLAGRIGEARIVIFHHLLEREARLIAKLEITKALKQLNKQFNVKIEDDLMTYIATNGFSFDYGARRARDLIRELVLFPISEKILELDGQSFKELVVKMRKVGDVVSPTVEVVN